MGQSNRLTLETMKQGSDKFAVAFGGQLELPVQHDFVARMQSSYLEELKGNLGQGRSLLSVALLKIIR